MYGVTTRQLNARDSHGAHDLGVIQQTRNAVASVYFADHFILDSTCR